MSSYVTIASTKQFIKTFISNSYLIIQSFLGHRCESELNTFQSRKMIFYIIGQIKFLTGNKNKGKGNGAGLA